MRKTLALLAFLLLNIIYCTAQTRIVSGKVTDETGAAVDGASIIIKGTKTGTAAKSDGSFQVSAKTGDVLIISAVNFTPKEVPIGAESNYNVLLQRTAGQINEVVVTALGIRREKKSLTYATQTIGNDQLNKSGTGNPLAELQGKASGLTVINSSGDAGSGTYVRLRGVTSITGENQPLMVVDGVPIDNSINNYDPTSATANVSGANSNLTGGTQPTNRGIDLNPNDIESITVLKGPAATALYGIRAASGALIITTKKGALGAQKMKIDFNSSASWSNENRLPELQDKYAQGSDGIYAGPNSGELRGALQ
jgi:TonB-dependent SusC/RagA subfamily outer membrane receptor